MEIRAFLSSTALAALIVAPATASTLTYRYEGQPLKLDETSAFVYLRELINLGIDPSADESIVSAINTKELAPFFFEVVINETLVPQGSVKGQTLSFYQYSEQPSAPYVTSIETVAFPSFATKTYSLTFNREGAISDWLFDGYWEAETFSSSARSGDSYATDPSYEGYFYAGNPFIEWSSAEPGTWTLVSAEPTPAPIPLPASLPLLAAGLGVFAAVRRRRTA